MGSPTASRRAFGMTPSKHWTAFVSSSARVCAYILRISTGGGCLRNRGSVRGRTASVTGKEVGLDSESRNECKSARALVRGGNGRSPLGSAHGVGTIATRSIPSRNDLGANSRLAALLIGWDTSP